MKTLRALAAATAVLAAALALVASPAGAADSPVLTSSDLEVVSGDTVTLTLTGCTGAAPHIQVFNNVWYEAHPDFPSLLSPIETSPGVWQVDWTIDSVSDTAFEGICASGARSARVQEDLEWLEMFPDPFVEQDVPMRGINGTDCDAGKQLDVWIRDGERMIVRHPTPGVRGDWFEPTPPVPSPYYLLVSGQCGTSVQNYIGFGFRNGPTAVQPPVNPAWRMSTGDGPPGTAYTASFLCDASNVAVVRSHPGEDDQTPVELSGTGSRKTISAVAGDVDDRYTLTCGKITDRIRFDVEAPTLALAADTLTGTDCPPSTEAAVRFEVEGADPVTVSAAIDAFGDWSVAVPALEPGVVEASASCGSVTYDPVVFGAAAVPAGPEAAPVAAPAAAPAAPVAGQAAYTG